ncbi:MAG TPA: VOC family protein [Nocardioidaceae bacterium]
MTSDGDAFQVMAPDHAYAALFGQPAGSPVPLFEVDDLAEARRDLDSAGVEIIGPIDRDDRWEWLTFRAPDGHLYELAARRR